MRYAFVFLIASPALAAEFEPKPSDTVLNGAAMEARVIGRTHEFFDGGRSFFSISGTYTYTYADGGVAYGTWHWPENAASGVICTAFRHGFARCDMYVESGGRLLLITEDGTRFPVRTVE